MPPVVAHRSLFYFSALLVLSGGPYKPGFFTHRFHHHEEIEKCLHLISFLVLTLQTARALFTVAIAVSIYKHYTLHVQLTAKDCQK